MLRRISVSLATLALVALLPSAALADTGGVTQENIQMASSVSMVVPASLTYSVSGGVATANFTLDGISTNNPGGVKVTGTFSEVTGPETLPVSSRTISNGFSPTPTLMGYTNDPGELTSATVTLVNTDKAISGGVASWRSAIGPITLAGDYVGEILFEATAN